MGGENCKSWVDEIYWNRFQFLHFVQFLRRGYDQHLALPKTFADNLKKKLPENVALKGPGGVVWKTGLTTRDDTLYFTQGWQQFVKDHSLKENDILVFKYNGESLFDVLIFDGASYCEKPASYFVRECGHTEDGGGYLNKGRDTDNPLEEFITPSNAGVECASPEKSLHHNSNRVQLAVASETCCEKTFNAGIKSAWADGVTEPPCETTFDADVESASPEQVMADEVTEQAAVPVETSSKWNRKKVSAVKHVQTKQRGRPSKVSNSRQTAINWVAESEPDSVGKTGTLYTSNRRPVTQNEKNNALQLAEATCNIDSLHVVMRPSHVYNRFFVTIPNEWITEHLSPRSQDVILRLGNAEWVAKYSFLSSHQAGGLTGGWKHFALDNNLEEFDVCVFTPAGKIHGTIILDVKIFRVVEKIAPLTLVRSARKRGRKK